MQVNIDTHITANSCRGHNYSFSIDLHNGFTFECLPNLHESPYLGFFEIQYMNHMWHK